jgi:hypothetical protein
MSTDPEKALSKIQYPSMDNSLQGEIEGIYSTNKPQLPKHYSQINLTSGNEYFPHFPPPPTPR